MSWKGWGKLEKNAMNIIFQALNFPTSLPDRSENFPVGGCLLEVNDLTKVSINSDLRKTHSKQTWKTYFPNFHSNALPAWDVCCHGMSAWYVGAEGIMAKRAGSMNPC